MSSTTVPMERAREALRLAEADPRRSAGLASAIVRQARQDHDPAVAAVAERALGLASIHLADLDTALRHLRTAVRLGHRAGVARLAGEARMTLAFALNRRGRSRQALREIDGALVDLDGVEHARAQAQRGAILHQLGRLDEALASYQEALPVLRRARDDLWTERVLSNRGVLRGHRQELAAAEADLHRAERLSTTMGLGLRSAFLQQNLGWIHMLRGDVPAALLCMDNAERRFRELGSQTGSILTDRSELLLSVLLVAESREAAEQAVREFERERRRIALPEARLLLARAATLDGDAASALRQARRAVREFARQQRPRWAALARFVALHSRVAAGLAVAPGEAARAADSLAAAGWPAAALEARLLAARVTLDRGRRCSQLELASRARQRGPALTRARAWHAEATLRLERGDRPAAARAVRAGLRILDEHRATLGATDLRAYASGHRGDLADLGLRIALDDGDPRRVLAWAEQSHASHLLLRPVRPPDDAVLAGVLSELRATVMEIRTRGGAGRATTRLVQRQIALERRIRDHTRHRSGDRVTRLADTVSPAALAAALGGAALLEFVRLDGALYVVTVVDGRVRLRRVGTSLDVRDLVDRLPFALHRLARPNTGTASRDAAMTMLGHAALRLDELLLRPLAGQVGDRPLVIVPTGPLQSVPWSILPSCAGRPVTVSPSASLWWAAGRTRAPADRYVAVAAGPGLTGARSEAEAVAGIHGTTALVGGSATVAAVTAALNRVSVAHLAAHGRVHAQNPLFSSLLLADGPLTVYDLERLERVPDLVVLAACDSGRTVIRAGDEPLGTSATFLALGARQLVVSVIPVPDAGTAPLMVAFHQLLAAGHPAPSALARAQQEVAREEPAVLAAAAGFVCVGAEFSLPVGTPGSGAAGGRRERPPATGWWPSGRR